MLLSFESILFNQFTFPTLVRLLREELQLLQEQGSYVGEVVKPMDKKKVLVKVCIIFCYLAVIMAVISKDWIGKACLIYNS